MTKGPVSSITAGSGNVFADLGFPDAEAHLLKAALVSRIQDVIEAEGWTQTVAAQRMGIAQPDVSRILRGRFRDYSVERLMRFLTALGCDVEIRVRPRSAAKAGEVCVSAFTAGSDHPPSLAAVVRALRARRGELERLGVRHAAVFGSVARGDARPDSDIDIVVDVDPEKVPGLFAQGGIQQALEGWLDHPVDLARRDRLRPGVDAAVAAEGVDAF